MPKSPNQKLKLLYLVKILEEQSDEAHPLTVQQMIDALAIYDVGAERKSIYDDIEALQNFGYDIIQLRGRKNSYYLGERRFQLPELKLLVDAAQSAKFITAKKSDELIRKISALASRHDAQLLRREVHVQGRVKTMNESIYYNVDILQTAIAKNRKVSCRYYEWAIDPASRRLFERRWRHNGRPYHISPFAMLWDSENYYLAAYDSEAGIIKHYRVDKMANLEILDEGREGRRQFESLDMAQYTKSTFGMFGGTESAVTLRFANRLIGVVVDRFGKDIIIQKADEEHFTVTIQAVVSPQFIAWLLGFGAEIEVLRPQSVIDDVVRTMQAVAGVY